MRKKLVPCRLLTNASKIQIKPFFFFFFLFAICATTFTAAQNSPHSSSVSGVIKEKATGEPLAGVSVKVKGKKGGVATNENGAFTIDNPSGENLVFSYVGFIDQELSVKNNRNVN